MFYMVKLKFKEIYEISQRRYVLSICHVLELF